MIKAFTSLIAAILLISTLGVAFAEVINSYPMWIPHKWDNDISIWRLVVVDRVADHKDLCPIANLYIIGCTVFAEKMIIVELDRYVINGNGIDTFVHEAIHARCDYMGGNFHGSNKSPFLDKNENYWETCGREVIERER